MISPRALRVVSSVLCAVTLQACATRYLPAPETPARVVPQVGYAPPAPREGEGQVTFDSVGERARVERVTSRTQNVNLSAGLTLGRRGTNTLTPTVQYSLAPLCETPCTANLPLGAHEVMFSAVDPSSSRASTVFVQSEPTPTIVRHAMGMQTSNVGGLIGTILLASFAVSAVIVGGTLALLHDPDDARTDGLDTAGFVTMGVGVALGVGAVSLGLASRPEYQPGSTVQWSP